MNRSFIPAEVFTEVRSTKVPWLNLVLFGVTCLSTLLVGAVTMVDFNGIPMDTLWHQPSTVLMGLPFSIAIMSILLAHEMGHYLACRYYRVDASLPYFIPFPLSPVGTMGAFIKIREVVHDRGSLLEIGVAGPIAGFVVAVIALVFSLGDARVVQAEPGILTLGEPLIFKAVEYLMGLTPPPGMDTYLHPVSFAAWAGFLVTALNLIPAAQLDGGHITYALFRSYHKWVSRAVIAVLLPLAIFYWVGWWVWIVLLLVLKLRHPPTLDDSVPLKFRHAVLGWVALALLILCFMPAPISLDIVTSR
jgi:membrane-associated protease RseP (regulator of RpoE activity)